MKTSEENNNKIVTLLFTLNIKTSSKTSEEAHGKKCYLLKSKIEACSNAEEKLHVRQSHDLHLQNGERARNCLAENQEKAKEIPRHSVNFENGLSQIQASKATFLSEIHTKSHVHKKFSINQD
uniref:Uncharacterized protein n=1 Tax=Glossina pallidipes TaxID=7398 RepID=A0A1A9ZWJ4_GLOPL